MLTSMIQIYYIADCHLCFFYELIADLFNKPVTGGGIKEA